MRKYLLTIFLGKMKGQESRDNREGRKKRLNGLPTAIETGAKRKVMVTWKPASWRNSMVLGTSPECPYRGCQPFNKWENGGGSLFTKHFIFFGKRIVISLEPGDSSGGQPHHPTPVARRAS